MTEADFSDAYYRHKDALYRFARRMTGSAAVAEDVVQDSFTALWRMRTVYDANRGPARSLLFGIARNQMLKRFRDERPQDLLLEDVLVSGPIDIVQMERGEAVAKAVQSLPALQREALILAEYEDFSLDEIVRATGADLAAVKSRLHRARENLRRILRPLLEGSKTTYGT